MQPLLNKKETCQFFGKIDASTLYRGIRQGRYPKPVKVGPGLPDGCVANVKLP
jgi:predicted DNA-binding transcriptional regulator AlpA